MVEYRDIPDFPGYRAGDDGTVWSCRTTHGELVNRWRRLRQNLVRSGYYFAVGLRRNGKTHTRAVHRLVMEAFVGLRPPGKVCCHNDGNSKNNRLENLRWDTLQSNSDDCLLHGTRARGVTSGHAKLTAEQVLEIRDMARRGVRFTEIGKRFNHSGGGIALVAYGDCYSELPNSIPKPPKKPGVRLTAEDVRAIRSRINAGETQDKIAVDFGMVQATISDIKCGRRHAKTI